MANNGTHGALRALSLMMTVAATFALASLPASASPTDLGVHAPNTTGVVCERLPDVPSPASIICGPGLCRALGFPDWMCDFFP